MTNGTEPLEFATIDQVVEGARKALEPAVYVWAASGAGQGVTVSRNRLALDRLALVPRVMRDVQAVDASSSFVGVPLGLPVLLAPIGALALYEPTDALASCAAAASVSTSVMCSAFTSVPWEDVAATAPGRHMFQLYVLGDRGWTTDVTVRVEAAGFGALCVTVDTPMIGRRDRSLELRSVFVADPASGEHPNLARHGWDPSYRSRYTPADLEWLCRQTRLPVVVKGIMTADDARAAVDAGVAGVYVSNHGGRQVDHAISTIEVLGEIVEAVGAEVDVAVDGGFTRGADVCKALALGARAVGIGRLQCWGLAAGGTAGLTRVLEILREEIVVTMANIGCRTTHDVTPGHVRWAVPAGEGV